MTANAPPPEGQTVPVEAFQSLSTMHQLTLEGVLSNTREELIFRILNRTIALVPYGRAVLFSLEKSSPVPLGVSGKSDFQRRSPLMQTYTALAEVLQNQSEPAMVTEELFPGRQDLWAEFQQIENGVTAAWIPILINGEKTLGLWVERYSSQPEWSARDIRLLSSLTIAYGATWEKLDTGKKIRQRLRENITRSRFIWALAIFVILMLVLRVHLRIVAPCEVIPQDPLIVAATLDGVIDEIKVQPGKMVKKGDMLFVYDKRVVMQEMEVTRQQVAIIRENLKRAKVLAFDDPKSRAELLMLENRLQQEEIRLQLAQMRFQRLEVRAERSGVVLVDDPHGWRGRPVKLGEKVMSVVDPDQTRLAIWLPEDDNIEFDEAQPVQIFLNVEPDRTLKAELDYVARHASLSPNKVPSFRAEAVWIGKQPELELRMGLTGTAMLYGERVSVGYWILRKPWVSIRQYFGI